MIEINYDKMAEAYNIFCMMNNLKSFCVDVDSGIYKIYSTFRTLKAFYMILQQNGERVLKYFDYFTAAWVNT